MQIFKKKKKSFHLYIQSLVLFSKKSIEDFCIHPWPTDKYLSVGHDTPNKSLHYLFSFFFGGGLSHLHILDISSF